MVSRGSARLLAGDTKGENLMATLSGQKAVTTAGTAVQLSTGLVVNGPVVVKALPGNTHLVYVGHVDGDVDSSNGLPLNPGESQVFANVGNLSSIWVDCVTNGEGVAWLALNI
jgi:hypothetical protein